MGLREAFNKLLSAHPEFLPNTDDLVSLPLENLSTEIMLYMITDVVSALNFYTLSQKKK